MTHLQSKPLKLLVVEDEPADIGRLSGALASDLSTACELVHAWRLDEAKTHLAAENFDAVVFGLSAPDGKGFESCASVREAAPSVPLVLVASTEDESIAMGAVQAGAQDYLISGEFDGKSILRRIRLAAERIKYSVSNGQALVAGEDAPGENSGVAAQTSPPAQREAMAATVVTDGGDSAGQLPQCVADGAQTANPRPNGVEGRPIRLLLVEDDPAYARLVNELLTSCTLARFEITHASRQAEALERLQSQAYDAILLGLETADSRSADKFETLRQQADAAPILILADNDNEALAIDMVRRGAHDCFDKSQIGILARSIRLAVEGRAPGSSRRRQENSARFFAPAESYSAPGQRRKHPRYLLSKPLLAIPVLPSSQPDWENHAEGYCLDLSEGGIGFEISKQHRPPATVAVVGVEDDEGAMHFATVVIRHSKPSATGIHVGAQFVGPERDILRPDNLTPMLDPQTHRFTTRTPEEALSQWCVLGVMRPVLLDWVQVCPECHGLPTFRNGCPVCGTSRLAACQLIHHFACAHVSYVAHFEQDGEIVCPKCRTRGLVVGADFETFNGPYRCLDCGWSDTQLEQIAQCLRCALRFPAHQCFEKELIGYHVNRLDPLALVGAS